MAFINADGEIININFTTANVYSEIDERVKGIQQQFEKHLKFYKKNFVSTLSPFSRH